MSDLVDSNAIEGIVGRRRHPTAHYGIAKSAERRVYVLHSKRCLREQTSLHDCRFSLLLDQGIDMEDWADSQDRPVVLVARRGRLAPSAANRRPRAPRIAGHGLQHEGAPHDEDGNRIWARGAGGEGRALCACGALSAVMPSAYLRRAWHREVHKVEIEESQ